MSSVPAGASGDKAPAGLLFYSDADEHSGTIRADPPISP
jgi:hypothetical protein